MTLPLTFTPVRPQLPGPKKQRPGGTASFTLVEVVLAVGVATFALVAILGLFSVGLNIAKKADQAKTLATMSLQVMGQLRGGTNSTVNLNTNFYFDTYGTPTNVTSAYYNCQVITTSANYPQLDNVGGNFISTILKFSWPASSPVPNQSASTNFASAPYRP